MILKYQKIKVDDFMKNILQVAAISIFSVFFMALGAVAEVPRCLVGHCTGDQFSDDGRGFTVFEHRNSDCGNWTIHESETDSRSQYVSTGGAEGFIYKITDLNYVDARDSLPNHTSWNRVLMERYGKPEHELRRPSKSEWRWRSRDNRIIIVEIHFSDVTLSFDKFPGQHRIFRKIYDYGLENSIFVKEQSCIEQRLLSD